MGLVQGTKSKFYISKDNLTFYPLAIDTMNPDFKADDLDATTLQDALFKAMIKGLKSATFGGNVKVKSNSTTTCLPGYKTVVKKSGTGVATTGLAMELVSGNVYKTTDTSKNLWSRSASVVVYDNAVAVASSNIEKIDYMFGVVTFVSGYTVTGAITVDATYLPLTVIAARNGYSLSMNANVSEVSTYEGVQSNGAYKEYDYGQRSISLTLDGFYDNVDDNFSLFTSDDPLVVEINIGNIGCVVRGWFYVTGDSQKADGDNPIGETLTCSLSSGSTGQTFSINIVATEDTTVIDRASYEIMKAYIDGTRLYYKAMLSDEDNIGYSGQMVVGDISTSGSLTTIEQMSFSGTHTGAVTVLS